MGNGILGSFISEAAADPYESVIFNSYIKNFIPILMNNSELRGLFANYIASSVWLEDLIRQDLYIPEDYQLGRLNHTLDGNHQIDHLRYELPTGELFPSSSHRVTAQVVDAVTAAEEMDDKQRRRRLMNRQKSLVDTHTSLGSDSLQYLLCATLIPGFLNSPDFLDWSDKNQNSESGHNFIHNPTARELKSLLRNSVDAVVTNFQNIQTIVNEGKKIEVNVDNGDDDEEEAVTSVPHKETEDDTKTSLPDTTNIENKAPLIEDTLEKQEDDEPVVATSYYETLLVQTVAKVDMMTLTDTFASDIWLRQILRFIENVPIAITIADARRRPNETFPLVYVNHFFEKLTGYHRQEVIGRNCRFLQSEERTEMQQVERMIVALREGQPLKLAVTNQRKDGSTFLNFLALRPVFNRENQYSFVVGISYDVAQAKTGATVSNSENSEVENGKILLGANQWWHSHQDEHDRLIEDLEGIDALLRLLPMLLV